MSESEWLTRKTRIDCRLTEARPGWTIVSYREGFDVSTLTAHAVANLLLPSRFRNDCL